jgi:pSer/pThr/pTyr-binding forkhead associated (FHA) protein
MVARAEADSGAEAEAPRELLLDQEVVNLGRDPTCEVPLAEKLVSRQHARVWREGPAYFIQDLHSTQGTLLNDRKLRPGVAEPVRNGDVVKISGYVITVVTWQAAKVGEEPDGTSVVAKKVLRGALKTVGEAGPVLRIPTTGDRIEIPTGAELVLGRDPGTSDLVIESERVSRKHAKVRRDWSGVSVIDLGSTNGVRVNGRRVKGDQKLRDRDEIEIGGVSILFIDPTEIRETSVEIPGVEAPKDDDDQPLIGEPSPLIEERAEDRGTLVLPPEPDDPGTGGPPISDAPPLDAPPPPGMNLKQAEPEKSKLKAKKAAAPKEKLDVRLKAALQRMGKSLMRWQVIVGLVMFLGMIGLLVLLLIG